MRLVVAAALSATLLVIACTSVPDAPPRLFEIARTTGLGEPQLVEGYQPVHGEDRSDQICYRVGLESTDNDIWCLTERTEIGPYQSWNPNCTTVDRDSATQFWCPRTVIQEEFSLRYDDPGPPNARMLKWLIENDLDEPEHVQLPGYGDSCFRFGPDDLQGIWCHYDRVAPELFGTVGTPCDRSFGGSFWCRFSDALPQVDGTWTETWLDSPRLQ